MLVSQRQLCICIPRRSRSVNLLRAPKYSMDAFSKSMRTANPLLRLASMPVSPISGAGLNRSWMSVSTGKLKLRKEISASDTERKTARALKQLSMFAGKILPNLDCDKPNDPMNLSINDLTIKVERDNRDFFLWEIGSGSNWLSYHVATVIAIQQLAAELNQSPIPALLILDQPTQVYFPAVSEKQKDKNADPNVNDEDIQAVHKLFQVLNDAVAGLNSQLQIIVLDHARPMFWEGLSHTNTTEEWRQNKFLVPVEWYEKQGF